MTSSFSSGKAHLEKPANGDFVDDWNLPLNSNADAIDACLSSTRTIGLSNVTINLNQADMQNAVMQLVGVLTADVAFNFLGGTPGIYIIQNATTGNFKVTAGTTNGGLTLALPASADTLVFTDGTNVVLADNGGASLIAAKFVPPGAVMDFAMSTAPTGWLVADGSAVSRTTYAALFANIGTTWGVGNGSTTFNLPPLHGQFRRGWDQSGAIDPGRTFASAQGDLFGQHNHGTNESPHTHTVPVLAGVNQAGFNNSSPFPGGGSSVTTSGSVTGLTIQNAGGSETRPKNYAVLTCIKT